MMHDEMRMPKGKRTNKFLVGEKSPGVTNDTTNKGLRPRNPPTATGEGRSPTIDSSCLQVDLLDTTNKSFSTPLTRGYCSD